MPENDLTDHDLARLTIFLTVHKGHLPDVPHGGLETHKRFAAAGLATLTEEPYEIPTGCDVHNMVAHESRITPLGTRVAEGMLRSARTYLARGEYAEFYCTPGNECICLDILEKKP